jgi:DNA-binding MarR family transcriptional regulator
MNNVAPEKQTGRQTSQGTCQVIYSLMHAAEVLQGRMEQALESVELSSAKFGALSILAEAGEPLPLGELAGRVSCVRSNMTQLMDRLEADGLVQRTNDPSDRRVIRAELTPLGRERAEAGRKQVEAVEADFAATLPEHDRQTLERLLASIR